MPIYEYACPDCSYQNDHLRKLADAPIAVCPKCGSTKYYKKISAAGFALKGTGWYVTDFRNGNTGQKSGDKKADGTDVPPPGGDSKSADGTSATSSNADSAAAPATSTPAAAPSPAPAPAPASSDK